MTRAQVHTDDTQIHSSLTLAACTPRTPPPRAPIYASTGMGTRFRLLGRRWPRSVNLNWT
ncbi:hypothetical protein JVU11DRAFT_11586 [Chiua virens]|nr:hypothetical protein JVU11DRAFT_11586 [Chiua virens]